MQKSSTPSAEPLSQTQWVVVPGIGYILFLFAIMTVKGVAVTPDGIRERAVAALLLQADWLPWRYLPVAAEVGGTAHSELNFMVYDYLLALILSVPSQDWALMHGGVNVLMLGGTLAIGALVLCRAKVGKVALAAYWSLAFAGWHLNQWAFFTQSEPLYTFELVAILSVAVSAFVQTDDRRPWRHAVILAALALICFFTRPTSPPVVSVALWLAVLSLFVVRGTGAERIVRYRWTVVMLVVALVGVLLLGTILLSDPWLLPEGSSLHSAFADFYKPRVDAGQVIWDRPETYIGQGVGFWHTLTVTVLRVPMFFWFRADSYSSAHNLMNTVFYPGLYFFTLLGVWAGLSRRSGLSLETRAVVWAALPLVMAIPVFHAFTLLDSNCRYRTPLYPVMYVIAAIGAVQAVEAIFARRHAKNTRSLALE